MPATASLYELYKPVQGPMEQVRDEVRTLWTEALQLVHGTAMSPPRMGGKLLRPALCLMSAGAVGARDLHRYVPLATAMELLHLAALAHDDVIDSAALRRGDTSLNARWDNHTAVLGGDYLVARAIALMGTYDSCGVVLNAIDSVRQMAEGELTHFGNGPAHYTEEGCIALARQKTASLFAVTCSTPTILVEREPNAALHAFGYAFGIAFQIVDDLLDLTQNEEALGKPVCADIVEGKKTLPILYMRRTMNPEDMERLDGLQGRPLSEEDRDWVLAALNNSGARERTESVARDYADEARAALDKLAPGPYRDAMHALTDFILVRGS